MSDSIWNFENSYFLWQLRILIPSFNLITSRIQYSYHYKSLYLETSGGVCQWISMATLGFREWLPGRHLDHLTIHSSCFSHSLLRLLSRRWETSGCVLSWPAYTTSGSMFSRMLRICWESCTSRTPGMQDMVVKAWLSLDMAKWDWNIRDGGKPKAFKAPNRFSFLPVTRLQGLVRFDDKEHSLCL